MINYDPKTWLSLIFKLTTKDLLKKAMPFVVFNVIYSVVVLWFFFEVLDIDENATLQNLSSVYSILGFVISLLLSFRTNTAYDRWWEGRKILGSLTNTCRSLAIRLNSYLINNAGQKTYFAALIGEFCFTLKNHLRGINDYSNQHPILEFRDQQHKTLHVLWKLNHAIENLKTDKQIDGTQYLTLAPLLTELSNILGAAERIKNTPIPYSYSSFIKKFIFIYSFTLPFAWMYSFGYYTILASAFVFYVLVSLEMLAEEIESPFGTDANDLPFDDICKNIQNNIKEILH